MKIAMVGLGRMGMNMAKRLLKKGHEVVAYNRSPDKTNQLVNEGATGAGHFTKMVHNGIEYGMMQAYGEGFEIMEASPYANSFNYAEIAHLWNQGSVVRSWLLELAEDAFRKNARLDDIHGYIEDSGEGRWTIMQALETGVPAEVITLSLLRRFRSRQNNPFTERVLAALRREFGGHSVKSS